MNRFGKSDYNTIFSLKLAMHLYIEKLVEVSSQKTNVSVCIVMRSHLFDIVYPFVNVIFKEFPANSHWKYFIPLFLSDSMSPDVDPVLFVLDLHVKYTVDVVLLRTYIALVVIVYYYYLAGRSLGIHVDSHVKWIPSHIIIIVITWFICA